MPNDPDTEEALNVESMKESCRQYMNLLQWLNAWDLGHFTMSNREFLSLPAVLRDLQRIYYDVKVSVAKDKGK